MSAEEYKIELEKAKQFIANEGYGSGSNINLNVVASLMVEWASQKSTSEPDKAFGLLEVSPWFLISEPPEIDGIYLVYNSTLNIIAKALYQNGWHCLESRYGDELTHWMNLPDIPTKG